jgi:phage gpG-like protein
MAATFEVEGGRQLRKSLKDVEDGLADLKAAHAEAAGIVAEAARTGAPRRTGRLSGSIRPSGTKTAAIVRAGGSKIPYAGVQEYGWPGHNIPPQPYIVPAAHDTESTWIARYQDAVDRLLSKVKGA